MRRYLRHLIPSMFHRRLLLLVVAAVAVMSVLGMAASVLTTGPSHRAALEAARDRLQVSSLTPTIRGRILDRKGRVLAADEAGWEVAVDYELISGRWPSERDVRRAAYRADPEAWDGLSDAQRDALLVRTRQELEQQAEMLWTLLGELGGVAREQIEHRRSVVIKDVQQMQSYLWAQWERDMEEQLGEDVPLSSVVRPIREERQAHAILHDVSEDVRQVVQGFIAEAKRDGEAARPMRAWRMVELRRPTVRRHPLETMTLMLDRATLPPAIAEDAEQEITVQGVGMHLLGQLTRVQREDFVGEGARARPIFRKNAQGHWVTDLGGYLPNDRIGQFGVESMMEQQLRGTRGRLVRHRDTDTEERFEALPGRDVRMTVDIYLQARVQAIMSPQFGLMVTNPWHNNKAALAGEFGKPLNGAAVVMDVETGEVLAAVSNPPMPLALLRDDPDAIYRDPWNHPYLNRAVASRYPPGSTLKPLVLLAAVGAGVHDLGRQIRCEGVFDRDHPLQHRCWIYRAGFGQHGPVDAPRSLAVSCNIYYYTLGKQMGLARLVDWLGRFGLGEVTGCGLDGEVPGDLPDPEATPAGQAINMGIGQGPVGWTPLQAATAYTAIARRGRYISPAVVAGQDQAQRDLRLNRAALDAVFDGMYGVVNDAVEGTGHHLPREASAEGSSRPLLFNVEGVTVYGKSGTAQTGDARWVDEDFDGLRDPGEVHPDPDTHGWFVAMVQPDGADRPTHVVVVVTEYGGSGARVSGPIVNQILHAMRTEGYLPE